MAANGIPEYRRLRPETSDQSIDGNSITERRQDDVPPLAHQVYLPVKAPTVRYVPHSGWTRYRSAVRSLVPFRRNSRSAHGLPVDKVGLFSYATFNWLRSTVSKIDECNVPTCSPLDSCDINGERLRYIWREEGVSTGHLGSSLFTVMWRFVKTRVIIAALIYILGLTFSILGPVICLQGFLFVLKGSRNISEHNSTNKTVSEDNNSVMKIQAFIWAMGLIATELVSVLLVAWSWSIICRTAMRLRSASMALIYNKLVHLSNVNTISSQQMVTLLGIDGQKLHETVLHGSYIITAPIVFLFCILSFIFILSSTNCDTLMIMSIFILTFPLLCMLVRLASSLSARATALFTRRLALMYEMLTHIRLVKMTAWESMLSQQLTGARHQELGFRKKQYLCDGFCTSIILIIPVMAFVVFLSSRMDLHLESFEVFPVLALFFGHMKDSLFWSWLGMKRVLDVFSSLEKFKSVLLLNDANKFTEKPINRLMAVNMSNAYFVWGNVAIQQDGQKKNTNKKKKKKRSAESRKKPLNITIELDEVSAEDKSQVKPTLVDITFLAPKGKLIGICGGPKSGKTSLLLAVLGHLNQTCGQVLRDGNCAYVGQQPWIWTASIKDNIVFKEPFQHQRYYRTVHSCLLTEDIDKLSHHDDTLIDEMGLSTGQKQRIALARALYSNRDIYLLDNPLSMVDVDTAAAVFDKCILKALKDRTVILVTRHVQFLTRCDEVYLMHRGKIVVSGTHEMLLQECPEYSSHIKTCISDNVKKYFVDTSRRHESISSMAEFISQNIYHTDSTVNVGSLENDTKDVCHLDSVHLESSTPAGVYLAYFRSPCSYLWVIGGLLSGFLYYVCLFGIPISILHSQWTTWMTHINVALVILMCVSALAWSFSFTTVVVGVSRWAHDFWFKKLCRAPAGYFQASPAMMSVLNLFSLNVQEFDTRLPPSLRQVVESTSFLLCAIVVLLYISPYSFAVVLLALLVSAVVLGQPHRKCLVKLHETEVASRVPLYQHLVSTVTGRTAIQAFTKDKDFIADFTKKCDENSTCNYLLSAASCWLGFRVKVIAVAMLLTVLKRNLDPHKTKNPLFRAITVGLVAVVLIFSTPVLWVENISADWIAGFVLVITMQLGGCMQCILQSVAESEARLKIFAESSCCIQGMSSEEQTIKGKYKMLPADWPTDGSITFQDVKTVSSTNSSQVLDGMSFEIMAGQKIGVLGLPGSGKKLLVDTLFRLVDVTHGKILIGGTNITCVPLDKLRSSITIVPQDPVLFAGTIRLNIDPHMMYHDSELWESLQKVNLQECIERLPQQLNTLIDRNGDKLSVRERQMLYLARACLRDTKVLVLEEPLATAEDEVDAMLNRVAWDLFPSATVLTIAHSMKYVVNCDKIMVVDRGKVVECDTPVKLYYNQHSHFSRMISASMGCQFETEL